jgi:hypothetical protein
MELLGKLVDYLLVSGLINLIMVPPVLAFAATIIVDYMKRAGLLKPSDVGKAVLGVAVIIALVGKLVEVKLGFGPDSFSTALISATTLLFSILATLSFFLPRFREALRRYGLVFSFTPPGLLIEQSLGSYVGFTLLNDASDESDESE